MPTMKTFTIRFTDEDMKIFEELKAKTGLSIADLTRLAIRFLRDNWRDNWPGAKPKEQS